MISIIQKPDEFGYHYTIKMPWRTTTMYGSSNLTSSDFVAKLIHNSVGHKLKQAYEREFGFSPWMRFKYWFTRKINANFREWSDMDYKLCYQMTTPSDTDIDLVMDIISVTAPQKIARKVFLIKIIRYI